LTLLEMTGGGRRHLPLLVTQRYGSGRAAVFATGGSWRWQMMQPLSDKTHEMFWQQLLRWLVADAPGRVMASTPHAILSDESRVPLRDRKSTRLNSSHVSISYAAFCWNK